MTARFQLEEKLMIAGYEMVRNSIRRRIWVKQENKIVSSVYVFDGSYGYSWRNGVKQFTDRGRLTYKNVEALELI